MYTGMLKRVIVLCILCASIVFAQQNIFSDIPLDNVHILRLQEAAANLGGNVTELKESMQEWQTERAGEIQSLRSDMAQFQVSLQSQITELKDQVKNMPHPEAQYPATAQIGLPPYVIALLAVNVILLILVIMLIFWLREQYFVHRETHKEEHIHPAPKELVEYVKGELEDRRSLNSIRMKLIDKGWTPSIIEHAIHAAREK
jgi:Sec-independent protein translocase protein TatA